MRLTGPIRLALALACGSAAAVEVHPAWEAGLGGLKGELGNFKSWAGGPGAGLCLLVDFGGGHLLRPRVGEWVFIRRQQMGDPYAYTKITHTAAMTSLGVDYQYLPDGNVNEGFYVVAGGGVTRTHLNLDLPVPLSDTYALFHVTGTSTKPSYDLGAGYQFNSEMGMEFRYETGTWIGPPDLTGVQTYRLNMIKAVATFRF